MCKSVTGKVDVDKIGIKKKGKEIEIAEETRKWSSSCTCDKVQVEPNT